MKWTKEPARYRSSSIATRGFCPKCGTSLFLDYNGGQQIAILLGAIDAPGQFVPSHHYGTESKLPWANLQQDLPGRPTDSRPQP